MAETHYNLIDEPWLKVIDKQGQIQQVGLDELFAHAGDYQRLAGDTRSQDLAILRFLLAILHTVYSRIDAADRPYTWLDFDDTTWQVRGEVKAKRAEIVDDLYRTWQTLFEQKTLTPAVSQYLQAWRAQFDFLGEHPFAQVTQSEYDSFVSEKKQVATGTGTVALKQIDRRVSESANSPAIFAPKAGIAKDELSMDELVRWVIAYQNFTGVTDKSKVVTPDKYSASPGWLYKLDPVFAQGDDLFETLMLNLILVHPDDERHVRGYVAQHPQWEWPSATAYIEARKQQRQPDNLAELYTTWSRMLHIQWHEDQQPTIFSAGMPMFDNDDAFIEPMTTWRTDKKAKPPVRRPATKRLNDLNVAMWRHFGQYVAVDEDGKDFEPGIVTWLRALQDKEYLADDRPLRLQTIGLISDGNATSQSPAAESVDSFEVRAKVMFDPDQIWPERINHTIEVTQEVGKAFWGYVAQIETLRNLSNHDLANMEGAKFYDGLNTPFKAWLAELSEQDNHDIKIKNWYHELQKITARQAETLMQQATAQDLRGKMVGNEDKRYFANIFTANNILNAKVGKILFK